MKQVKPFTQEEIDILLNTIATTTKRYEWIKTRDLLIYNILRYSGCRIGECLRMNLNFLDLDNGEWTVPAEHSKNGLEQKIYLIPKLVMMLKDYVDKHKDLFIDGYLMRPAWTHTKKKADTRFLSPKAWRLQHRFYLEKAGLLEVIGYRKNGIKKYARNTHSIRSSYAIKCYKELVVTGQIGYMEMSKLLRHKNPSSTLHYLNNMNLDQITTQKKYLNKVFC